MFLRKIILSFYVFCLFGLPLQAANKEPALDGLSLPKVSKKKPSNKDFATHNKDKTVGNAKKDFNKNLNGFSANKKISFSDLIDVHPSEQYSVIILRILNILFRNHILQNKFNYDLVSVSNRSKDIFLRVIDPYKIFLSQKNISEMKSNLKDYKKSFSGDLTASFALYSYFMKIKFKRYEYALSKIDNISKNKNLDSEVFILDRSSLSFFANEDELNDYWLQKIYSEFIIKKLDNPDKTDEQVIEYLRNIYNKKIFLLYKELNSDSAFNLIANSFAQSFDPHSSYLSPNNSSNFHQDINLSFSGIGASLSFKSDYIKIVELIPGGPAELSKKLFPGDKILAVKEGFPDSSGKFIPVYSFLQEDFLSFVKGQEGTPITFKISRKSLNNKHINVTIIRNKVYLNDRRASLKIYNKKQHKGKIAVIKLSNFYKGISSDVADLLLEINKKNIQSVLVDLRGNPGGLLIEALNISSLFLGRKPLILIKSSSNEVEILGGSHNQSYTGNLSLLVDRMSASASEILAAAIKDYGRGLVLGSSTFGKGTVQLHMPLNRFYDNYSESSGSLKVTVSSFHRVGGNSTQELGVSPDFFLPSLINDKEIGESSFENTLPIEPLFVQRKTDRLSKISSSVKNKLLKSFESRINEDLLYQEFQFLVNSITESSSLKSVQLGYKNQKQKKDNHRLLLMKLYNLSQKALSAPTFKSYKELPDNYVVYDFALHESLNITNDLFIFSEKQ